MTNQYPKTTGERRLLTLHGYDCAVQMGPYSINGYITLPDTHPWLQHESLEGVDFINVHGGVTYHEGQTIGFDTNHHTDGIHPESIGYKHFRAHLGKGIDVLHWTWQETTDELARLAEQAHEADHMLRNEED